MSLAKRQLLVLLALSFLFATMISMSGYSSRSMGRTASSWSVGPQSAGPQVTLTETERRALSQYFLQYVIMKRNRVKSMVDNRRETETQANTVTHDKLPVVHVNNPITNSMGVISEVHGRLSTNGNWPVVRPLSTSDNNGDSGSNNNNNNTSNNDIDVTESNKLSINGTLIDELIKNQQKLSARLHRLKSISLPEVHAAMHYVNNKSHTCWNNHASGMALMVMVISSPANFEARQAIRDTWGGFAVERGGKLLFVIGQPEVDVVVNHNQTLNQLIGKEDSIYGDILQAKFVDSYDNLTLKSLSLLNWVNQHCNQTKYVLKVDDDMFLNMQLLIDFAETSNYRKVVIGKIARKWLPHRNLMSKYYVPFSEFNQTSYPNFATGPAYMVTADAIPGLMDILEAGIPIMRLEDVFITGVLAEKANIRRLNYFFFRNVYFKVDQCNFNRFITSHRHSAREIARLWKEVYQVPPVDCNKKTTVKVQAPPVKSNASST